MRLAHISEGWIAALVAALAFDILFPLALAFVLRRRLKVGWRYFGFGALVFVVFQGIARIPAVQIIQGQIAPQLKNSPALLWIWLGVLALTAGLFEEVGRYVGYRVFLRREEKTWGKALMYGAGHGGIESILLVGGLALISLINILVIPTLDLSKLPAEQQKQIVDQFTALAAQPGWFPLLGAYERLGAITFHLAMSVVVLQVFRRGQHRWLWFAVLAHAVFDFAAAGVPQAMSMLGIGGSVPSALAAEGVVTIGALLALWTIFALRERPTPTAPSESLSTMARPADTPPDV